MAPPILPFRPTSPDGHSLRTFLRGQDVLIEPRKLWPSGLVGRKGKIGGAITTGRALAYGDDPAWADALADLDRFDGPLGEEVTAGVVALLGRWQPSWAAMPVAVVAMPSQGRPQRVQALAELVATQLSLPIVELLQRKGPPAPAQVASIARAGALLGALSPIGTGRAEGRVLLVDDTYRPGWTMTVAGTLLAERGADQVLPLVLHQLP